MNRLVKAFKNAFDKMKERKWDTIYVLVDMHETALKPTWSPEPSHNPYPLAVETLRLMSEHKNIKLILWSSSPPAMNLYYAGKFKEQGVEFAAININPFVASTDYADFESKLYMNVILDDKAGFDPEQDWEALYDYFISLKAMTLLSYAHNQMVFPKDQETIKCFLNQVV